MDVYSKKTRDELIAICKERKIKGYSSLKKDEILQLLTTTMSNSMPVNTIVPTTTTITTSTPTLTTTSTATLKMIDLFAGTGAFTSAFEKTGHVECVFSNDMVEWSKNVYDTNFAHKLTLGNLNDIKTEDIPKHDILTGGFPCQPFSIAGKQEGFQDERSNVFWKILAIIDYHKPSCVILENVKNLVSHDEGKTFEIIKNKLTERGYHIRFKVLDTSEITGIPQHRERIYIVCIKSKDVFDKFTLDFPNIPKAQISSLLEPTVADKYYYTDKSSTWDLVKSSVLKKKYSLSI